MRKIAIFGAEGQLGRAVAEQFSLPDWNIFTFSHAQLDITQTELLLCTLTALHPDVVVNCAAITDVDFCETHPEEAEKVHYLASQEISRASDLLGFLNVFISTDYVFDGETDHPYEENSPTHPLNHYGRTKLLGEEATQRGNKWLIIRTSAVFGKGKKNFVVNFLRRAREGKDLHAVADRKFSPTYTQDLASALYQLIVQDKRGIYHLTNSGECSPYEWALEICRLKGIAQTVHPIRQEELHQKARRPKYTTLANKRWLQEGFPPLPTWQDALKRFLQQTREIE
ncbi:MAG: dTDP-4-dehydrorhamnose reductase [bacterium JZ-2024 1]